MQNLYYWLSADNEIIANKEQIIRIQIAFFDQMSAGVDVFYSFRRRQHDYNLQIHVQQGLREEGKGLQVLTQQMLFEPLAFLVSRCT